MTINRIQNILYERMSKYWSGATVVWGTADKVTPDLPLVTLRLGTVVKAAQPVTQLINGIVFTAYPSETTLQIDLFTRGEPNETESGVYYVNTAINDMLEFINFLDSVSTVEWSSKNDLSILPLGNVQDVSEIINDTQWRYRAFTEVRVMFTRWVAEYNGVLNESCIIFDDSGVPTGVDTSAWKQTASGGGSEEMATSATGFFDETDIEIIQKGDNP